MKKVMVLVLSIAVALAFASMVIAQTNPPPAKARPDTTTTTTTTTTKVKPVGTTTTTTTTKTVAPKARVINGTVVSVDAVANTIVVKYKDVDRTFTVDPAARITTAGKECKLADIQKDAQVTVVYKFEGKKKVAIRIK